LRLLLIGLLLLLMGGGALRYWQAMRDPDRTPFSWSRRGPASELPLVFDLSDPEEASRWQASRGAEVGSEKGRGLVLPSRNAADGPVHVSREIPIGRGLLGTLEIRTERPAPALSVAVYLRGRIEPVSRRRAEPDPEEPARQRVRFTAGRWDIHPVDGLRIEGPEPGAEVVIRSLRVSSERYLPVSEIPDLGEAAQAEWAMAFGADDASLRPRNAIVLLVDSLRADHLSLYGYSRETSPHLDRLSRFGVVFETAWSQAACTFPSVNSLLTSQPVTRFFGEPARERRSIEGQGGLAERLQARGYRTLAVSASPIVRATDSYHNDWGGGFAAGFDRFDERCEGEPAECVYRSAIDWIDESQEPFFAYLHVMEPHAPYRPPATHIPRFAAASPRLDESIRLGDPGPLTRRLQQEGDAADLPGDDVAHLVDLYDEEVHHLDEQLARLFEALRERGLLRETIVLLVSDHGESFLEHGDLQHCRSVYEPQVRTPFIVWTPGVRGGRRVAAIAQNIDVLPTVMEALGQAVDPGAIRGRSLVAAMRGSRQAPGLAFAHQGAMRAVRGPRLKWIEDLETGRSALYDVHEDPEETLDLSTEREAEAARLAAALERYDAHTDGRVEESRALEAELRALGYLD
jgi:arylsulfatase A-like enzyme